MLDGGNIEMKEKLGDGEWISVDTEDEIWITEQVNNLLFIL